MSKWLIAGLGNPGRQYEESRHNVGFLVVDALARRHGGSWTQDPAHDALVCPARLAAGEAVLLAKPQTFMNDSGRSVAALSRYFRIPSEQVIVVYDELNLPVGRLKISIGGSAGGHNGVESLLSQVPSGFLRYRIGIGLRTPPEISLTDFVLGKIPPDERKTLEEKMPEYLDGLQLLIDRGPAAAMNQLNRKTPPDESDQKPV